MKRCWWTLLITLSCLPASAEQVASFHGFDVHYVVLNTLFLKPEIASQYGITRAADRAIVNVSVLDGSGQPATARIQGTYKNLLSQNFTLTFNEHSEGQAIYYIAEIKYSDQDILAFTLTVATGDQSPEQVTFSQRMYTERQP